MFYLTFVDDIIYRRVWSRERHFAHTDLVITASPGESFEAATSVLD